MRTRRPFLRSQPAGFTQARLSEKWGQKNLRPGDEDFSAPIFSPIGWVVWPRAPNRGWIGFFTNSPKHSDFNHRLHRYEPDRRQQSRGAGGFIGYSSVKSVVKTSVPKVRVSRAVGIIPLSRCLCLSNLRPKRAGDWGMGTKESTVPSLPRERMADITAECLRREKMSAMEVCLPQLRHGGSRVPPVNRDK